MSLFVNTENYSTTKLSTLRGDYFVDTSGSTSGQILRDSIFSAKILASVVKPSSIVGWNAVASPVKNFNDLKSTGGTYPACFARFVKSDTCMVIYTDGQIDISSMSSLKSSMNGKICGTPIIIVFAVPKLDCTIQDMQYRYVNMSIPETFLSLSNDVIILITSNSQHRILMTKGCFSCLKSVELTNDFLLSELPIFDVSSLDSVDIVGGLGPNIVKLANIHKYIDLNILYAIDDVPTNVLIGLCDRTHLPKLNVGALHNVINKINRKMTENPELDAIRNELFLMSSSSEAGSEKHQQLITKYNEIRSKKNTTEDKEKLAAINKLLEILSEYQKNSTSIVYGSNRATRATTFDESELDILGICAQAECPIMLTTGNACIVLKIPSRSNYIEEYTSDFAMENPFEFGQWLINLITPGLYSQEMAKAMKENPYTREKVIGYLPLSENPETIMKHMSKLFGGNKELWHFVRGYISFIIHTLDKEWLADDKEKILGSVQNLVKNYNADIDLKGGGTKVPLEQAFKNVLTNYSTCLRDRTYNDILAIIKISRTLFSTFMFDEQKIRGMAEVVKEFMTLLELHKKHTDMKQFVMEVDEYEHHVTYKKGIQSLIANILWYDIHGQYRLLKLQLAIDKALCDKTYGNALTLAMTGEQFNEKILECSLPEPTGSHFNNTVKFTWTHDGLPECKCIYCGHTFSSSSDKRHHLKQKMGQHFYNGHNASLHAIEELGPNASEKDIFVLAKNMLYKWYGDKKQALHTQRCKDRLLFFIQNLKKQRSVNVQTN